MSAGIAQRLRGAAHDGPQGLRLSLRELLHLHGEGSGAVLLMLMALLSTVPIAGAGTVLSLGIFALAWAWLRGRDTLQLPERLAALTLNDTWTRRSLRALAWTYERAERWLRPRWQALSHTRARVWWGLWIALMAALIFLPLPLGNLLPGASLMLLSLGWLFRDGLVLLLSTATGAAGLGYAVSVGHLAFAAWQHLGF
ncbi:MAG: exopolysaccharide biosynthesis protein [Hydrogenophaga sp.]|nr:exopolysaccharide biosynthesis protein [Hydrogenophaga sp.]